MDSFGFDVIIVETTGVGQSDTDIVDVVDTVVLVLAPNVYDEVQLMKAGIMEVADVYVVNKIDLDESRQLIDLFKNLKIGEEVLEVCSLTGSGVDELKRVLEAKKEELIRSDGRVKRRKRRVLKHAEYILIKIIRELLKEMEKEQFINDPLELVTKVIRRLYRSAWDDKEY